MPCGVYISYQQGDWPWADHVCQSLVNQGIPCRTAPREQIPPGVQADDDPEGSLILILSSSQSPLPRQLIQELENVRNSGLEFRAVRADAVQTPLGLASFLRDLRGAANPDNDFSIPSQFIQARRQKESFSRGLPSAAPAVRGLLEAPKAAPRRRAPAFIAALVGMLFVGVWAIRASSVNMKQYEQVFAEQQAQAHRAQADRVRAHAFYEVAQTFASQDQWREADQALSQAIDLDREYAQAYFERGRARYWQHQYQAAIEDFKSVTRLDPNLASGAATLRILAEQARAKPATIN